MFRDKKRLNQIFYIFLNICLALALTIQFKRPKYNLYSGDLAWLRDIVMNLRQSLKNTSFYSSVLLGVFLIVNKKIDEKKKDRLVMMPYIAFLIAMVWLLGKSFSIDNTLYSIHSTAGQWLKSLIFVCGITYFFNQFGYLTFLFFSSNSAWLKGFSKISENWNNHTFLFSFFTLLLCWIPHILINYPGSMCWDAWNQIAAFFGVINFTSHHPPAHTWLIGSFVKLGLTLGNTEWGLFVIVLLQSIIFAAILAYVFITMKKLQTPRWLIVTTWLIAVISPIYTTYIETILKDVIYSYMFLLFMIELVYIIFDGGEYWKSIRHIGLLALSMTFIILFRNNGKYIIYPMSFVLIIMIIKEYKKCFDKQILIRGIGVIIISLFLAIGSEEFLIFHYNIQNGSIREALSLPFQQTARYIAEYGDEVTDEEKKAIDTILDYDSLAEKYDPRISDPVKNTFRKDSTKEDLINYFKVWLQQFKKHPLTYFKATMNQNYYLLYPCIEDAALYNTTIISGYESTVELLEMNEIQTFKTAREILANWNRTLFFMPVIGMFSSTAFYNIILLFLFIYAIHFKMKKIFLLFVPLIINDLIIVAAPVIHGHVRYAFPIIYSMPIVVAMYLYLSKEKNI